MTRDDQFRQALSRSWRQGRRVPRNVYAVIGDEPSDQDVDIGRMDSGHLASEVCEAHNTLLASTFEREGGVPE